jgi:hypothetical protein
VNQFNNIGSMFPGAQFKNLRDNAKLALTLPGQHEIVGLVIKNVHGDVTIIEQDRVQVFHHGQVEQIPATEKTRALQLAQIECEYWKKVCDEDPGGYGMEGMTAAGNIIAAIVQGLTPEEFKKKKEENENPTTDNRS